MIKKTLHFIKHDVWRERLDEMPKNKGMLIRQLRILLLAVRGFNEDKCLLRASALTYYTLISIVPVIAMIFGIAKGFGFEKLLETQLREKITGQEEVLNQILGFASSMLENTSGGIIAGFGVALLFWSVMKVLGNIEDAFNGIWEIKTPRTLMRKFSDYLSFMLIAPLLVIVSGSVNVFIQTQVTQITESIEFLGFFSPLIFFLMKLLPFTLIWLLFTFIFMVMPNTKVLFRSALIAGIIGGTLFQFTEWLYLTFQIGVAKQNAIYGSFAALPLFLVWMHTSWLIVLFGAEISFANQNVHKYEFEIESHNISHSFKRLMTLMVAHKIVKQFEQGESALTAPQISAALSMPIRIVNQILFELNASAIISEMTTEHEKEPAWQPARSTDSITIQYIIDKIDGHGVDDIPIRGSEEMKKLKESLELFGKAVEKSDANVLLKTV